MIIATKELTKVSHFGKYVTYHLLYCTMSVEECLSRYN